MAQIEPLTPSACEEKVRSHNSKGVSRLKEMGKEVSYLDQRDGTHNH